MAPTVFSAADIHAMTPEDICHHRRTGKTRCKTRSP